MGSGLVLGAWMLSSDTSDRAVMSRCPFLPLMLFALAASCASTGPAGPAAILRPVPSVLGPDEHFQTEFLLRSPRMSAFLTTVHGALAPHYHERHEELVLVLSGQARVFVEERWYELIPGDVLHLPRGVVHALQCDSPSSVISVFSPPFDGSDRVYLEGTEPSSGP